MPLNLRHNFAHTAPQMATCGSAVPPRRSLCFALQVVLTLFPLCLYVWQSAYIGQSYMLTNYDRIPDNLNLTALDTIPGSPPHSALNINPRDPHYFEVMKSAIRQRAINNTIILIPFNYGSTEIMLNLRCSLFKLNITNVLYYAMDMKARNMLSVVFHELVLYNVSAQDVEAFYSLGTSSFYNYMMRQRVHVWRWLLEDVGVNCWFVDADVVVLKDWRWMADANYFLYPDAPYNSKFGSRKPDIIMQMDGYSKENAFMDLSDPENRDEIPKGCAGFFFLRKTVPSVNLLKKLLAAFEVLGDVDDQPVLNGFFRNNSYVRFLDVHPNHPISYLHTDEQGRRFEPEILAKLLPQLEFANGGVLLYHDYKETEYWVVHPNGFGSKELELQRRGLWYLDGYHQCIFQVNQGNKTK